MNNTQMISKRLYIANASVCVVTSQVYNSINIMRYVCGISYFAVENSLNLVLFA